MSLFVVGTDTEVGKTVVSALICAKYGSAGDVAYWKPVASGSRDGRDVEDVARLSGIATAAETYLMAEPLSPHLAARLEDRFVDPRRLTDEYRRLVAENAARQWVIEGIGGVHVPLNDDGYLWSDWMEDIGLPAVVVSRSTLGTLNHTFLTLEALRRRGVEVLGVVLNGPRNPENLDAIRRFGSVPVLGELEPLDPLDRESLGARVEGFDPRGRLESHLG